MVSKSKVKRKVRKHDPQTPPIKNPKPPGVECSTPVPSGVELKAQRLIREAGSVEDAKRVLEKTVERESGSDFLEDTFAGRWGFPSRKELLAASKPLFPDDSSGWWATKLGSGRWIVWSRDDFSARSTFETLQAARDAVEQVETAP